MASRLRAAKAAVDRFPPVIWASWVINQLAHTTPGLYIVGALAAGLGWALVLKP